MGGVKFIGYSVVCKALLKTVETERKKLLKLV
jgi:hypothetical protein